MYCKAAVSVSTLSAAVERKKMMKLQNETKEL